MSCRRNGVSLRRFGGAAGQGAKAKGAGGGAEEAKRGVI